MGTNSVEGIRALARTSYAVAGMAGAMIPNTISALSKKPSMGVPMEVESSSTVGWYTEIGSASSWKEKKKRRTKEFITSDDAEREMRQPMTYGRGNMGKREEKEGRKDRKSTV